MKKFAFLLAPLMAISFLTNCGGKTDPTPPGPKLYTVTFDTGEGGSVVHPQTVIENECATEPKDPTREGPDDTHGYVLDEWQLDGVAFDFNTPITKDITLKATWEIVNKYTVTFDTGEGGTPVASQKVLENHFATKPEDPTRDPSESTVFLFDEWKKDDGSTFNFKRTVITGDITLTANWTETTREYDITFKPGEGKWKKGSTDPIVKKIKYGDTPTCDSPIKSSDEQYDYLFSNWSPKIEKVTGSSPKTYTANFAKLEKNATNLVVDFPSDATNKTIAFNYEGTLDSVDWGDDQTINGESSHTYSDIGQYTISIHGDLTNLSLTNGSGAVYSDGNKYITNIKLKNGITSIDVRAFQNCSSLASISIPNSITSIGSRAFKNCFSLVTFDVPSSVTAIKNETFSGCSSLTSINIPNSVISIEGGVFENCSSLASISIPSSVASIGNGVFVSCSSLASIVVDSNNPSYDSRENCNAIISTEDNILLYGCMNTKIPNGVTAIGYKAFEGSSKLTSINIPSSVTSIDDRAFAGCVLLTSIFIPSRVTMIGTNAFEGCTALHYNEKNNALYLGNESNMYHALIKAKEKTIASCLLANNCMMIAGAAFSYCSKLTSINIPNSVISVCDNVFEYCSSLTSIFIPSSVTTMGAYVFNSCSKLTEIRCQCKESEIPPGWNARWKNGCNAKVTWGASPSINTF